MTTDEELAAWVSGVFAAAEERRDAAETVYQHFENTELINRVRVHAYLCAKTGHPLATVIKAGGVIIARTAPYKLAPATNLAVTVEAARRKNTLDGDHYWPGTTFEVAELARWGDEATITMDCWHARRKVKAVDILATCEGVRPGHPGKPTRL